MNGERFILTHNGDVVDDFESMEAAQEHARRVEALELLAPDATFEPLRFFQVEDDVWEAYSGEFVWQILVR